MADMKPTTPVVIDNPPQWSKINWTQFISFAAGIFTYFGYNMTPEQQMMILQILVLVTPVFTWVFRTWFTGKPATVPQLKAALKDEGLHVTTKKVQSWKA